MSYENDLDECLTYFQVLFEPAQFHNILLWVA